MRVNSLSQGLNVDLPRAGLEPRTSRSKAERLPLDHDATSTVCTFCHNQQAGLLAQSSSHSSLPLSTSDPSDKSTGSSAILSRHPSLPLESVGDACRTKVKTPRHTDTIDFMGYEPAQEDEVHSGGNPRWLMGWHP
ncbi:hypothetical protein ElyMa_005576300 [Elysia marginata]|uniref:Uncharacterized protein n=1 Tax=Elysia marginata TaxID=1093978 RepID=A0AAV4F2D1_9GAST|nr:hypothetical protein ElyMa_005576300 [Elysia marginata]